MSSIRLAGHSHHHYLEDWSLPIFGNENNSQIGS